MLILHVLQVVKRKASLFLLPKITQKTAPDAPQGPIEGSFCPVYRFSSQTPAFRYAAKLTQSR